MLDIQDVYRNSFGKRQLYAEVELKNLFRSKFIGFLIRVG